MSYLRQSWIKLVIDYIGTICKDARGHCARLRGSGYRGDNGKCTKRRIRRHFWLAALLHRRALHRYSPCCCHRFEGRFFLKNSAGHRASVDEKKNRIHTIFRSYCRYDGRYYEGWQIFSILLFCWWIFSIRLFSENWPMCSSAFTQ